MLLHVESNDNPNKRIQLISM